MVWFFCAKSSTDEEVLYAVYQYERIAFAIDMDKLPVALRNKNDYDRNGYIEVSSKMATKTERRLYYDQNIHY